MLAAPARIVMQDYEVFVDDDRYSVPSLYLISASSLDDARVAAEKLLSGSEHHQRVEVRCGGESLFAAGSLGAANS
jgi:hypothetical protein